jgi:Ca2+-binding RTX toxin-like protein
MYHQINSTETFRERQLALLEESEERRLARRLGITRRTILLMATMTLTVLVVGGLAYAATIKCDGEGDLSNLPGECRGTEDSDNITGTAPADFIDARAGNDTVNARAGDDNVTGREGQDTLHGRSGEDAETGDAGSDTLFGEGAHDTLSGGGGVNVYFGGPGPDRILANTEANNTGDAGPGAAGEEIHGGPGDEVIFAADGLQDFIDCGGGTEDRVNHDQFDVLADNCEIRIGPG